jgi:predicted small secreted protein|tara:strand:- start:572 stop:784 length:213 start_codon:yes stop_codon:yes gene_type:complete
MMSLRGIHLLFIAVSIALTAMTTLWGIGMYVSDRGSWGHLAFSVGSLASGLGMSVYLVTFIRKTRRIGME